MIKDGQLLCSECGAVITRGAGTVWRGHVICHDCMVILAQAGLGADSGHFSWFGVIVGLLGMAITGIGIVGSLFKDEIYLLEWIAFFLLSFILFLTARR